MKRLIPLALAACLATVHGDGTRAITGIDAEELARRKAAVWEAHGKTKAVDGESVDVAPEELARRKAAVWEAHGKTKAIDEESVDVDPEELAHRKSVVQEYAHARDIVRRLVNWRFTLDHTKCEKQRKRAVFGWKAVKKEDDTETKLTFSKLKSALNLESKRELMKELEDELAARKADVKDYADMRVLQKQIQRRVREFFETFQRKVSIKEQLQTHMDTVRNSAAQVKQDIGEHAVDTEKLREEERDLQEQLAKEPSSAFIQIKIKQVFAAIRAKQAEEERLKAESQELQSIQDAVERQESLISDESVQLIDSVLADKDTAEDEARRQEVKAFLEDLRVKLAQVAEKEAARATRVKEFFAKYGTALR